jgi:bifunctional DNA-binding transcriptional regulator/antitoxin component of YhaV-PrlF toxin-antitoxin module
MRTEVKRTRRRGTTRVSSKHQITLPIGALDEAHVRVGDRLRVVVEGDGQLRLIRERSRFDRWIGAAPGLAAQTDLETLRDEWER